MEAVPKVPMLHFSLKQTQQKSSFSRLKQYIAEYYQEDPETFSKEIYDLETLRAAAYNPSIDEAGYNVVKRYYCQLHSLQNRFPIEDDRNLVNFVWRDIYSSNTTQSSDLRHDMGVVLYNYGALHTQVGASASRSSEEEMKLVCTLFQRAAWAFETIREKYSMATTADLYPELLIFMQNICFAQAQECILEKSLIDNRKSIIVAKVASQIIEYYNSAFAALLSGGEEGMITEIVGSRQFKEWRQYIQFKVQYMACILLLYQGQHAEEQQKMGERVTLYQAAFDRLEDARKEAKHLNNMPQVNEALTFVLDVVEAKRKAAKNENEYIYHEEVPELSSIATIAGANLVKGIPFNVADAAAEDIFHRLVPIKAHEHSSLYSEEKTQLLRKITQKIEAKDNELNQFMESLSIDSLSCDIKSVKLPQSIIDRCAAMNARPSVIDDLIRNMSSLAEICVDVENMLKTIQELMSKEEFYEKDFQQTMGYRPSSHFVELNREFMKYQEAHNKAGDSNDTLRKAMEMHVNNLRILSKALSNVQASIPTCSTECDPKALSDTQMLLNKVNEMRVQRAQLYATLNENIQKDDITAQLVAWGEDNVEKLFQTELAKHDQIIQIIEQNLVAQENILKTFTDAYAKCAHFIKAVSETKHKRDIFFSSLIASYDVYDDLLGKSLKGLEFYKKLQSNIHKLCARVRSARDVHDEERQQRIDSMNKKAMSTSASASASSASSVVQPQSQSAGTISSMSAIHNTPASSASVNHTQNYASLSKPSSEHEALDSYRTSSIRPTPIGQENTGIYDVNQSSLTATGVPASAAATTGFNYGYQTNAAATMPSNYHPQSPSMPSVTASSANASPMVPSSTPASLSSAYSNQQNAHYSSHLPQSNSYAANSGYINPIYSSLSTPSSTISTMNQAKSIANTKIPSATSVGSYIGGVGGMGAYANSNANLYISNLPATTSTTSGLPYNYSSMAANTQQLPQPNSFNQNSTAASSSQPQSYMNYSQSTSTGGTYVHSPYGSGQMASTTASTFYSQAPQTGLYQTTNISSVSTANISQSQAYAGASYSSTSYTMPNSQVSGYQTPSSMNQYSQQQQQQQNQQTPQTYSTPSSASLTWSQQQQQQQQQQPQQQPSQQQQQVATSSAYGNYPSAYSSPQLPSVGATQPTSQPQSAYPASSTAYNYYGAQYANASTLQSKQLYGNNDTNLQHSVPIASEYLASGYGHGQISTSNYGTQSANTNYTVPASSSGGYGYGAINPTMNAAYPSAAVSAATTATNYSTSTTPQVPPAAASFVPNQAPYSATTTVAPGQVSYGYGNTVYGNTVAPATPTSQNTAPATIPAVKPTPAAPSQPPPPIQKPASKFDLLSDMDNIPIPAPTLQPIKTTDKPLEPVVKSTTQSETTQQQHPVQNASNSSENAQPQGASTIEIPKPVSNEKHPSIDKNDSIEMALSELSMADDDANLSIASTKTDIDSKTIISSNLADLIAATSGTCSTTAGIVSVPAPSASSAASVPPSSANIETFYKEVQRYEKLVNGLTTKTLNGTTPLEIKWKELIDLLQKDASKRTVSISKLFPEKNRNMLSVPYDHSRVLLPTETDNYINAAHIRDLGSQCNHFILADAPTFNTVKDFWCMIWSQQAACVICLSTPDEGPILLFPKQLNTSQIFGDYSVIVLTEQHRLYVIERSVRVTSSDANISRTITILQAKQWPTKNSIGNIIGVSQNIIDIVSATKMQNTPIIVNCLTNLERSSLIALTITCSLALECDTPIIINVTDVWYRICSQRKNILNDTNALQQSMQIVLQCCREFIKKRSPKTLGNNTQTNYYFIEEEETPVKDPFKDLDPLWKLK